MEPFGWNAVLNPTIFSGTERRKRQAREKTGGIVPSVFCVRHLIVISRTPAVSAGAAANQLRKFSGKGMNAGISAFFRHIGNPHPACQHLQGVLNTDPVQTAVEGHPGFLPEQLSQIHAFIAKLLGKTFEPQGLHVMPGNVMHQQLYSILLRRAVQDG